MSTRNPNNWTKVGDTVRFWQESLVRLNFGARHQDRLEYAKKVLGTVGHCHDMTPPQSLGELCLEVAGDELRAYITGRWIFDRKWHKREATALRRAMYHKNRGDTIDTPL